MNRILVRATIVLTKIAFASGCFVGLAYLSLAQTASKPAAAIQIYVPDGYESPPPLPTLDEKPRLPTSGGVVKIPQLGVEVVTNGNGVVVVVRLIGKHPVPIYVARQGGLKGEFFVPGDSIQGVNGRGVKTPSDLDRLTQEPGWKYIEGIDSGTDIGSAYIGRVYIP